MTIPLWTLLAFAAWTLLVLVTTHGIYRWSRILTGRDRLADYADYKIEGNKGWYVRGMRAHANCVENLPVHGAIVLALTAAGIRSAVLDGLALTVLCARIVHTLVHVSFEQTSVVVGFRSLFFNIQWLCMLAMVVVITLEAIS